MTITLSGGDLSGLDNVNDTVTVNATVRQRQLRCSLVELSSKRP